MSASRKQVDAGIERRCEMTESSIRVRSWKADSPPRAAILAATPEGCSARASQKHPPPLPATVVILSGVSRLTCRTRSVCPGPVPSVHPRVDVRIRSERWTANATNAKMALHTSFLGGFADASMFVKTKQRNGRTDFFLRWQALTATAKVVSLILPKANPPPLLRATVVILSGVPRLACRRRSVGATRSKDLSCAFASIRQPLGIVR
jgi:hypothetical protein